MKWLLILVLATSVTSCAPTTHIYIVRHAEKATNDPKDPELTSDGVLRANVLALKLRSLNIKKIYATNFKRTTATAKPLSDAIHIPVENYHRDTSGLMMRHLVISNLNALVVGHSNTVLPLLDSLNISHAKKDIGDNEYDNLFIINIKKGQVIGLQEQKYGPKS